MNAPAAETLDAIPVASFERHNRCLSCGADLFGQPRAGMCAQCGASTRESGRTDDLIGDPRNAARLRSATVMLLYAAILSGLCPAAACWFLASDRNLFVALLMTAVFISTAATATIGEMRFRQTLEPSGETRSRSRRPLIVDLVAGAGLAALSLAAFVEVGRGAHVWDSSDYVSGTLICIGSFALSATAWRSIGAHRLRARVTDACFGTRRRGWFGLGVIKAVYETLWLGCCFLGPLLLGLGNEDVALFFAFGAMFGLGGYAVIWLAMIVMHALLLTRMSRAFRVVTRGFEVAEPSAALFQP